MLNPDAPGLSPAERAFRLMLRNWSRWNVAVQKATHPEPEAVQ